MLKNGEIKNNFLMNYNIISYRKLEVDLETIWQTTNADNIHIREQLLDMRFAS